MEAINNTQEQTPKEKLFSAKELMGSAVRKYRLWQIDRLSGSLPDTTTLSLDERRKDNVTVGVLRTNDGMSVKVWHDYPTEDFTNEILIDICRNDWSGDFEGVIARSSCLTDYGVYPARELNTISGTQDPGISLGQVVQGLKQAQRILSPAQ